MALGKLRGLSKTNKAGLDVLRTEWLMLCWIQLESLASAGHRCWEAVCQPSVNPTAEPGSGRTPAAGREQAHGWQKASTAPAETSFCRHLQIQEVLHLMYSLRSVAIGTLLLWWGKKKPNISGSRIPALSSGWQLTVVTPALCSGWQSGNSSEGDETRSYNGLKFMEANSQNCLSSLIVW